MGENGGRKEDDVVLLRTIETFQETAKKAGTDEAF